MIKTIYKQQLSDLLAKGHAHFGKVAPRKPYREGEEGGSDSALTLKEHPFLMNTPIGAASDLINDANKNPQSVDEALKKDEKELSYELKQQPVMAKALAERKRYTPPSPSAL